MKKKACRNGIPDENQLRTYAVCKQLMTLIHNLYDQGNYSRTRMMTDQLISEHTMFDRRLRNLHLKTLVALFTATEDTCGIDFWLEELIRITQICVTLKKELTVYLTDPREAPKPGEARILTRRKKPGKK